MQSQSEHAIIAYTSCILYFEKCLALFHARLGSDVCPRVDNQTLGDTLQDSTRSLVAMDRTTSAISQLSTQGYWSEFLEAGCPSTLASQAYNRIM